jgi:hypothetical protein
MTAQEITATPKARRLAAKRWIEAMFAYGADLEIIDYAEGRSEFRFTEPETATEKPFPGLYPSALRHEVRAILEKLGKVTRLQAAA